MRILLLTLSLTCAVAHAQPAPAPAAPADDVDIAKAHFNTGEVNYEHGRFADAAREFEEAYRLSGKAPLLYNVGKSYDGGNDFARALDAYQRFLAAAPPDNPDRDFAKKRVELLQSLVGKIALRGAVDGSTLTLDGKPAGTTPLPAPLVVNPGPHKIELAREGYATFRSAADAPVGGTATVAVKQTEAVKVVTVTAREQEKPVYKKWWLWAAVGGAVVAAGVITAVVVTSSSADHGPPTVQLPQVR
jgi:tetratricopeptide (TPR) repeat protein